jgi:formylglycine-generating enzyme required for sulfatase activity
VPSYWVDGAPPPGKEQHPVVDITYDDAQAYADWSGKKLPTREQWTRAFRGDSAHLFPWGDTYEATWLHVHDTPPAGTKTTAPVKSTPRDVSPYQVYNLGGNASEFVRGTFFQNNNPYRMVKGGTFEGLGSVYALAPMFSRYGMDFAKQDTGFRCVVETD